MNIGIFIQSFLPIIGGAQISTHCLANSLVSKGHNVTIFTLDWLVDRCKKNNWDFKYKLVGVKIPPEILFRTVYPWWKYKLRNKYRTCIDKYNIDVVQIINSWPWIAILDSEFQQSVPIILRAVGDDIQSNKDLNYGRRRDKRVNDLITEGYKNISLAIANSDTTVSEYLNIGLPKSKIRKITPGVDTRLFAGENADKIGVRRKYGLPESKTLIIAVGRNHPKKGYSNLIASLKYLNEVHDKYSVVIVGKNTSDLIDLADEIGQKENYFPIEEISTSRTNETPTFPSEEMVELYKAADYYILPSLLETFGNVKLEAMAAGIPVLVSDAPGARDSIINRENGLVIAAGSPVAIAKNIIDLDESPDLIESLVSNGKKFAQQQDWINVAGEYVASYKSVLQ